MTRLTSSRIRDRPARVLTDTSRTNRYLIATYQQNFSEPALFNKATQDAYFCQVRGTIHFAFKDLTEVSLANGSVRNAAAAMRACMLSFFNKYLKGQDDHLLDDPTNTFPVLFNFASKQERPRAFSAQSPPDRIPGVFPVRVATAPNSYIIPFVPLSGFVPEFREVK